MAFDGLLMRESGFRGIYARLEFLPTRSAFMAFGFMAFDGFTGFESHQKPRKAIKSQLVGFLMDANLVLVLPQAPPTTSRRIFRDRPGFARGR